MNELNMLSQLKKTNKKSLIKLGFLVKNPGMLSLIQDAGRFGATNIGLTNGGPIDMPAFYWANRLCGNKTNISVIEVSLGGLVLIAQYDSQIAVTGAPLPLTINGQVKDIWRSYAIKAGDVIAFGFSNIGVRCYLAVKGGFDIPLSFGSTSTVCREQIGGLSGNKLQTNDIVPCTAVNHQFSGKNKSQLRLAEKYRPHYSNEVVLRTVASYQQHHFSSTQQSLFYSSEYQVSKHYDRMGYRLNGPAIKADVNGILSEGICHGAIQIPSDGHPIVLLNDRQTIGGYPKIGAVIALDTAKLGQLNQGAKVHFKKISIDDAYQLYHSHNDLLKQTSLTNCD